MLTVADSVAHKLKATVSKFQALLVDTQLRDRPRVTLAGVTLRLVVSDSKSTMALVVISSSFTDVAPSFSKLV